MRTEAELAAVSNKLYKLWADNGLTIREVVQLAIDWADAHQPFPWISVKKRLPKDGDFVFVRTLGSDSRLCERS